MHEVVRTGVDVSVHRSVQVPAPVGEAWTVQLATPEPPPLSAAVPVKLRVPDRFAPAGTTSVDVTGFVLSIWRLVTAREVAVRPTLSVTMAWKE